MFDFIKFRTWTNESQIPFSKRTGIDQGGLSRIERGIDSPSVKLLEKVLARITPKVLFMNHSPQTPTVVGAMLAYDQIDVVEHEPDAFNAALKQGLKIAVITNDKAPFLELIAKALEESGLPHIPTRGIKIGDDGTVEPWND